MAFLTELQTWRRYSVERLDPLIRRHFQHGFRIADQEVLALGVLDLRLHRLRQELARQRAAPQLGAALRALLEVTVNYCDHQYRELLPRARDQVPAHLSRTPAALLHGR